MSMKPTIYILKDYRKFDIDLMNKDEKETYDWFVG